MVGVLGVAEALAIISGFVLNLSGCDLLTETNFLAQLRSVRVLLPLMLILLFTGFLYTALPAHWSSLQRLLVAEDHTSPCLGADGFAPVMALLPAGSLNTGEVDAKGGFDGQRIAVDAFAISRCEVTFDDYQRYVNVAAEDSAIPLDGKPVMPSDSGWGTGLRPLINVDWVEATNYAEYLSTLTDETYSLPSEVQWEYAARAGTSSDFYTGKCISENEAVFDSSEPYDDCPVGTSVPDRAAQVATKTPNPWKLYNMAGNVLEWSCSEYQDEMSAECAASETPTARVLRGGSWRLNPSRLRSAYRNFGGSDARFDDVGIRLARAVP